MEGMLENWDPGTWRSLAPQNSRDLWGLGPLGSPESNTYKIKIKNNNVSSKYPNRKHLPYFYYKFMFRADAYRMSDL